MKSCMICGVGGQGTVIASRIIAAAAIEKGFMARTAETIGMSQRGGCVVSHVRIGDKVSSPMIPYGKADIIIGFEPGEVVRNLHYLKKDGIVIVCKKEVQPVTVSLSGADYNSEDMIQYLKENISKCYIIDGEDICDKCGSSKVLNVALVGALGQCDAIDLTVKDIERVLHKKLKPEFLNINKKALVLGSQCI